MNNIKFAMHACNVISFIIINLIYCHVLLLRVNDGRENIHMTMQLHVHMVGTLTHKHTHTHTRTNTHMVYVNFRDLEIYVTWQTVVSYSPTVVYCIKYEPVKWNSHFNVSIK